MIDDAPSPEIAAQEQPPRNRGQFKPGRSGNPRGKPKGARNRAALLIEAMLEGEAAEIGRRLVDAAKAGEPCGLRLAVERLMPPKRDRAINVRLTKLASAADVPRFVAELIERVAGGELTLTEGESLTGLATSYIRAVEASELAARLAALEERFAETGGGQHERTR